MPTSWSSSEPSTPPPPWATSRARLRASHRVRRSGAVGPLIGVIDAEELSSACTATPARASASITTLVELEL
jgi:hypothetical protein